MVGVCESRTMKIILLRIDNFLTKDANRQKAGTLLTLKQFNPKTQCNQVKKKKKNPDIENANAWKTFDWIFFFFLQGRHL